MISIANPKHINDNPDFPKTRFKEGVGGQITQIISDVPYSFDTRPKHVLSNTANITTHIQGKDCNQHKN